MAGERTRPIWPLLLVILVPLLVFAGALDNELVNWDDGIYIESNPLVTEPGSASLRERITTPDLGYPLPLPVLLYGWLWRLGGVAWPFHAFSVAVHVLNGVLLFLVLRRELDPEGGWDALAAVAALGFALHPVVVEPVAWATGLKDLLFGTGALLGVLAVTRGRDGLAIPGTVIAYASKPASALLGLALPWFHLGRSEIGPVRRPAVAVPLGLIAFGGLGLLVFTFGQETDLLRTTAEGPPTARRILGAAGLSLRHLVAPAALAPRYPLEAVGATDMVLGALALGGLVAAAAVALRGRRPAAGWLALLAVAYAPVSNLQPLLRFTADSYLYVPWLAGTAALAHGWVAAEAGLRERSERAHALLQRLPWVVLPAWALLSALQVEVWRDTVTLWGEAHAAYPEDGELVYRYGDALGRDGDFEAELALYAEHADALERSPKVPIALVATLESVGELDELDGWYRRAFASEVKQDDGVYWHYVEYVARHPERHPTAHDAALRHAIGVYLASQEHASLSPEERARLAIAARKLGLPAEAEALAP